MIVPFVLAWAVLLSAFGYTFYRELKRTPWDLLESLVLFTVLGHVLALPIAYANGLVEAKQEAPDYPFAVGTVALAVAMFMAGGAVWVFRRLNRRGERRRVCRLLWMIPGLLLFPSMLGPFFLADKFPGFFVPALGASVVVWLLLVHLNDATRGLPDPWVTLERRKAHQASEAFRREHAAAAGPKRGSS